jgi:hypothetical protein
LQLHSWVKISKPTWRILIIIYSSDQNLKLWLLADIFESGSISSYTISMLYPKTVINSGTSLRQITSMQHCCIMHSNSFFWVTAGNLMVNKYFVFIFLINLLKLIFRGSVIIAGVFKDCFCLQLLCCKKDSKIKQLHQLK